MQHRHLSAPRKRIFAIIALALLVGGLVVSGLWMTNAFGWRGYRLSDVEAFIGAELPEGAEDAQFLTEVEKARIVWLRFRVSADVDLNGFLKSSVTG